MSDPRARLQEVLGCAEKFLQSAAATPASAALLVESLRVLEERDEAHGRYFPASTHLPLLVFETLTGDWRGAVPLAAATTLLFVGVDVLDDFMDGDPPAHWKQRPRAEVLLGAATLLSAAPQALIAELDAPPRVRAELQRLLARALLEMSAGQLADVRQVGNAPVSLDDVFESVAAKSGAMLGAFAAMAAALAGARVRERDRFAELGQALGVASQLRSDCRDLYGAPVSRDIEHRARTAPIAMRLEQLDEGERTRFVDLLERAREGGDALDEVRSELVESEVLEHVATLIELYCETAHQLVGSKGASNRWSVGLHEFIDEMSMLGPARENGGSDGSQKDTTSPQEGRS